MGKITKVHTGCKFYKYEENSDQVTIVRVKNVDYDSNMVKLINEDNSISKMKYSDLLRDVDIEHFIGDDGVDHTDHRDQQRRQHIQRQHFFVRLVIGNKPF